MENANAMQVTLGTIVTVQRTSAHAGPRMDRSAVTVAAVSVGSASVQSLEPLEKHVRSAQPAQMLAAPRGEGLLFCPHPRPVFHQAPSPAGLLCLWSTHRLPTKTCAKGHQNNGHEMLGVWGAGRGLVEGK